MLSITKLRNLKAIHNYETDKQSERKVVINHKTTKFESNLQLKKANDELKTGCYQSQNYEI